MNRFLVLLVVVLSSLGCNKDASQQTDKQAGWASDKIDMADPRKVNDPGEKEDTPKPDSQKKEPTTAQPKEPAKPQPKILQDKTWTWAGSQDNYAKYKDQVFEVGMGDEKNGVGSADAGVEIENVRNVTLSVEAPLPFKRSDDNSFAGFMVDYHTADGYTKRVALSIGMYSEKRWTKTPIWGKRSTPDRFIDLGSKKECELDLKEWAPDGWDGKVWLTVSLQNTGQNTLLKARLSPPEVVKKDDPKPINPAENVPPVVKVEKPAGGPQSSELKEPSVLKGHTSSVNCVTFSPNGKLLASCSEELKLWDADSGKEIATFHAPDRGVVCAAFSPDGKTLASGGYKVITLADVDSGKVLLTIKEDILEIRSLAFSPSGEFLASGGGDSQIEVQKGEVRIWDVKTGKALVTLNGTPGPVFSVAFSPDGKLLAGSWADGSIFLWDAKTGKEVRSMAGDNKYVKSVAFSPDGKLLATGGSTAVIWDVATGNKLLSFPRRDGFADGQMVTNPVDSVSFSPDGKLLATSSTNIPVIVYDAATGEEAFALTRKQENGSRCVAFSPDGKRLATGGSVVSKNVILWPAQAQIVTSPSAAELNRFTFRQIIQRLGEPTQVVRSTKKPNVGLALWKTGDDKFTVVSFIESIDGSNITLVLTTHDNRTNADVQRMKKVLDK